MGFVIHWHESAMELHVFPIPIPPPTSLSTRSHWVFPVHQAQALVSCIQPGLVICFTLDNIHVLMLFSRNIPPSPSPTESRSLFCTSVYDETFKHMAGRLWISGPASVCAPCQLPPPQLCPLTPSFELSFIKSCKDTYTWDWMVWRALAWNSETPNGHFVASPTHTLVFHPSHPNTIVLPEVTLAFLFLILLQETGLLGSCDALRDFLQCHLSLLTSFSAPSALGLPMPLFYSPV